MITVFGSINMDLVAIGKRLPKPGETISGDSFTTAAGGKGANQALAAQRAGAKTAMAGAVGDDSFATDALVLLRVAGTDLTQVKTVAGATGTAVILIGEDGENMISVIAGANASVSAQDAKTVVSKMQRGDTLLLQFEVPAEAIEVALSEAKAKGVITVINTAPLTDDAKRLAPLASIAVYNETEFELMTVTNELSPSEREKLMLAEHDKNGQTVIVTLGADGIVAARSGKIYQASGLKIEPIDTVGAGDTFCGYLAASLDEGMDFEKALKRAAAAGSLACTKSGAQPSIPYAREVDASI